MTGTIILFGGAPGKGKTMQCAMFRDGCRKVIIDVENKAAVTIRSLEKNGVITIPPEIKCPVEYTQQYKVDHIKTFDNLISIVEDVMTEDYDVIIFDSVTHLRNSICANHHCAVHKKKQVGTEAWREVNKDVRDIIEPLVNYCRATGKVLIMTSHLKDEYVGDTAVGKCFDVKEFIEHFCDVTLILEGDTVSGIYTAVCTRSNDGGWREDISGRICVDILFEEKGMI